MPERIFIFIQMEFPWALGPPDGRYLLRPGAESDPERVVVLATLGAARSAPGAAPSARRHGISMLSRSRRRGGGRAATTAPPPPPPPPVPIAAPPPPSAPGRARAPPAPTAAAR